MYSGGYGYFDVLLPALAKQSSLDGPIGDNCVLIHFISGRKHTARLRLAKDREALLVLVATSLK
jgi:hypothetical protein